MSPISKSLAFIRTDLDQWGLAKKFIDPNLCGTPEASDQMVTISIIGSSRDGKSTLLNLLYKKITNGMATPFEAALGTDMVTNGINYLTIPGKAILMDCQGMALKSAKYDHFLTLIVYLTSNVIILNVRQQLDLQVLNNLLAVFSFLSEIPDEHKRKDKPTLIIRIKDFQDTEKYEQDPDYLINYVKKWLTKSGDQFDHIKEAFNMTFNIEVLVTEYPIWSEKDRKKKIIDIHDDEFYVNNPSIYKAVADIVEISKKYKNPVSLMTNRDRLEKLIDDLCANKNIDYRKLDLYHNIASVELQRYVSEKLNFAPYNDSTIIVQMDGTRDAWKLYMDRWKEVMKLKKYTYEQKFKDVTPQLKSEIFDKWFDGFNNDSAVHVNGFIEIVNICKDKNMALAQTKIRPYYDAYKNKFAVEEHKGIFDRLMNNIMQIFDESKTSLIAYLNMIDVNVADKIMDELNEEKRDLEVKQNNIRHNNTKHEGYIVSLINSYNPQKRFSDYVLQEVQHQLANSYMDMNDVKTYEIVLTRIKNELTKIFEDNKKIWYLNNLNQITISDKMLYDANLYMPEIKNIYWEYKNQYLTKKVFLTNISPIINTGIYFVQMKINQRGTYILMTDEAYYKLHGTVIGKLCDRYEIFDNLHEINLDYEKSNIVNIDLTFPEGWIIPLEMQNSVYNDLYKYLIRFSKANNVCFVCN